MNMEFQDKGGRRRWPARRPREAAPCAAGLALVLGGAFGLTPMAAAAEPTILPGYWESQNRVSFPLNDASTSRQCITKEKVAQFLSGPSSRHYRCTYSRSSAAGGAISASGQCVDKNGIRSTVEVRGAYTPTSFKLNADLRIVIGGLPIPISASTDARRIADNCPDEGDAAATAPAEALPPG